MSLEDESSEQECWELVAVSYYVFSGKYRGLSLLPFGQFSGLVLVVEYMSWSSISLVGV